MAHVPRHLAGPGWRARERAENRQRWSDATWTSPTVDRRTCGVPGCHSPARGAIRRCADHWPKVVS